MASTLLLDDFNERSKMTEKKYKQKLRSLIGGDSYQDAVDDMVEAEGGKLTNTVSHQGKSPEKYQQDVDRMVERGAQLRKRQSKKDNDKMLKEGDPRQTYEKGGITAKEHISAAFSLYEDGAYNDTEVIQQAARNLSKAKSEKELKDLKFNIKNKFARSNKKFPNETNFIPENLKSVIDDYKLNESGFELAKKLGIYSEEELRKKKAEGGLPDLTGDGKVTQADVLKGRGVFQEGGSLMMPEEGMPVDTYDNIPPEEMEEAMASQLPDDEMEDGYLDYVIGESLDDSEQQYLAQALQNDPQLGNILDKVMTVASEFSGAGEVEGPGTGVSDSIPARLSDGEFVITKKATDQIGAENLQTLMDDAERAYDGGYQMKAIGGYMEEDPEEQDSPLSQTDEEIKKLMMGANKMPSLR
jgi:hypothetical protein